MKESEVRKLAKAYGFKTNKRDTYFFASDGRPYFNVTMKECNGGYGIVYYKENKYCYQDISYFSMKARNNTVEDLITNTVGMLERMFKAKCFIDKLKELGITPYTIEEDRK